MSTITTKDGTESPLSPAGASLVRMAVSLTRMLRDERQEMSLSLSSHQDVVTLLL